MLIYFDNGGGPSPAPSLPVTGTPGAAVETGLPDWVVNFDCCQGLTDIISPWLLVAVGVLMILDILSGLVKAFAKRDVDSSVMRQGLFHKAASLLVITLTLVLDSLLVMGFDLATAPLATASSVYIIIMESFSILENVAEVNPELGSLVSRIKSGFKGVDVRPDDTNNAD